MTEFRYRKELDSLSAYKPGRSIEDVKKTFGLEDVIKLASNENPFGCPLQSIDVSHAFYYPDQSHHPLLSRLCALHDIDDSQLVLGNGSDDILQMIGLSFLSPKTSIVIPETTFSVYEHVATLMGASSIIVPMEFYKISVNALVNAVKEDTQCIFVANPNNPTGTFLTYSEIESLLQQIPEHVIVVLDEAYRHFVTSEPISETEKLCKKYPNVLILRTFSKAFGLSGFRIGYGIGSTSLIQALQKVRQPFNVNQLAMDAAVFVLNQPDFLDKTISNNTKERVRLSEQLTALSVSVFPSEANFICFTGDFDADDCALFCMKKGIIVRSLRSFGMSNGIRVSIGLPSQNEKFLTIIKEYFHGR